MIPPTIAIAPPIPATRVWAAPAEVEEVATPADEVGRLVAVGLPLVESSVPLFGTMAVDPAVPSLVAAVTRPVMESMTEVALDPAPAR